MAEAAEEVVEGGGEGEAEEGEASNRTWDPLRQ